MSDAAAVRRVVTRLRTWSRRWAVASALVAAWAISLGTAGDAGNSAFLAVVAVGLAVTADARRRRPPSADAFEHSARSWVAKLGPIDRQSDPSKLSTTGAFVEAARILADTRVPIERVVMLAADGDVGVACAALGALARRTDLPGGWTSVAIRRIRHADRLEQFFLLEVLAEGATEPVIGSVLSQLDEGLETAWIASLIERRLDAGETVSADTLRRNVPWLLEPNLAQFLEVAGEPVVSALHDPFMAWRGEIEKRETAPRVQTEAVTEPLPLTPEQIESLRDIGRVSERRAQSGLLVSAEREQLIDRLAAKLEATPRRSLLLVGENGVGKTTLARAAVDRLGSSWLIFEAGAAAIHAGAVYVGELETRVDELARLLAGRSVVWLFPEIENALYAGQHSRSPRGLLDALLPHVEQGRVLLIGESTPESYARLIRARPRIASALDVERVAAADRAETAAVAAHRLRSKWNLDAPAAVLAEAFELAQDFAPNTAPPGNVLRLVDSAAETAVHAGRSELAVGDVLKTLSRGSGLPVAMLDSTAPMDVDAVREFFESRILGQPDAVDCMVDRIALIKAGLTDPTRPLAVFLFVGPTGTGKTELAKATAEFVFGTQDRLVRLDMGEFQTPDSLERLLTDRADGHHGASLLSAVRENPFSVVLLDEFEKAAPPIWDAFLQLFDDGRLTDQKGRTADFRRCLIILTSNLGASVPRGAPFGFGRTSEPFRVDAVREAARRSFRPEFVNRLDEIVVFRPLGRDQMKTLLDKELASVLERRGLRSRPWAVIFDDSAIDFLIEVGFSPDLGARPLKRAVETHFLAPLARTIVQQQIPQGDQFLFITANDGRVRIRFVDPDEDGGDTNETRREEVTTPVQLNLRRVALTPAGNPHTARFLLRELERVLTTIHSAAIRGRKEEGLAAISRKGFWEDDSRFALLADVEHLDRMEEALRTAQRLGSRLQWQLEEGVGVARELVELLAIRLYVLECALIAVAENLPDDLFLQIRATDSVLSEKSAAFMRELEQMYKAWAERRGMRIRSLDDGEAICLAVSGLGAGTILPAEAGLHILERVETLDDGRRDIERVTAVVDVVPQPRGSDPTLPAATRALAEHEPPQRVVRRYRGGAAPLVRDSVRSYRTGRLDRVLAGDFDLF
jgi:ATP-dependent Clp protease ATP-binding subunit ClpC